MIHSREDFLRVAMQSYDNPIMVSVSDFVRDIRMFDHLNTATTRYIGDHDPRRLRVMCNYVVTISNRFGVSNAIHMLGWKTEAENLSYIWSVVNFLGLDTSRPSNPELIKLLESL